jgi:hypothetical protein
MLHLVEACPLSFQDLEWLVHDFGNTQCVPAGGDTNPGLCLGEDLTKGR